MNDELIFAIDLAKDDMRKASGLDESCAILMHRGRSNTIAGMELMHAIGDRRIDACRMEWEERMIREFYDLARLSLQTKLWAYATPVRLHKRQRWMS